MGASYWSYYVPYEPDINKALQQLRERVFKDGDYSSDYTKVELIEELERQLLALENIAVKSDIETYQFVQLQLHLERLKSLPEPITIEAQIQELLEVNSDNGTHSILDIIGISSESDYGIAAPLYESELLDLFATVQPTKEMVNDQENELLTLCDRWEATYIVVYQEDAPKWIYFCGISGD